MSITAAAVKKAAAILLPSKSARRAIGFAAAFLITLALLPVMLLLAMGHQLTKAEDEYGNIDFSQFMQSLSPEQKERFSQMEEDGKAIEKEMEKLGIKDMIVKAQMIYLTYSVQRGQRRTKSVYRYTSIRNVGVYARKISPAGSVPLSLRQREVSASGSRAGVQGKAVRQCGR